MEGRRAHGRMCVFSCECRWTDGRTDRRTDGWMDGWGMDGWMDGWMGSWTDGRVDIQMGRRTCRWMSALPPEHMFSAFASKLCGRHPDAEQDGHPGRHAGLPPRRDPSQRAPLRRARVSLEGASEGCTGHLGAAGWAGARAGRVWGIEGGGRGGNDVWTLSRLARLPVLYILYMLWFMSYLVCGRALVASICCAFSPAYLDAVDVALSM